MKNGNPSDVLDQIFIKPKSNLYASDSKDELENRLKEILQKRKDELGESRSKSTTGVHKRDL